MKVQLKNDAGIIKEVPVGFSWTMLFFGPLVPLFRGDLKWMVLFLLTVALTVPIYGLGWVIIPFIYNKRYIINLLECGYKPANEESIAILVRNRIITDDKKA
jgi:hypothetical protein